jgi:aspartate/methionine/tyrosine aminotransferase
MDYGSPYMEWIKEVEFPRISFARSGMGFSGKIAELGLTIEELSIAQTSSYGSQELKSALKSRFGVPENNIFLNMGTSGANFVIFSALFRAGDEVLVESPVYDPLPEALRLLGIQVKCAPRRFENGFQFEESEIDKLFTRNTKALVITNLHNPSGVLVPPAGITSLASIAKKHNAYLIVDEIYLEFYFEKRPKTAFLLDDNIIVTSSLTKSCGFGGLRMGWGFCPEEIVLRAQKIYNLIAVENPPLTEYITFKFLTNNKVFNKFADKVTKVISKNLPLVESFIQSRSDIEWMKPTNGIICFPMLKSGDTVEKLFNKLYNEYQTLITPGRFFYEPRGFRLGYGLDTAKLREGLNNIAEALNTI